MKKNLLLTIAFVATVLFGAWFSESIKIYKAGQSGYQASYVKGFGRHIFTSEERGEEYETIFQDSGSYDTAKNHPKWHEIAQIDYAGHARFETFTIAVMWGIGIIGFLILLYLFKKSQEMNWQHYVAFFISLFFMRTVVLAAVNLFLAFPCGEAKALFHYGLDARLVQWMFIVLGLLFLVVILYNLPKKERLKIIFTGAIGSVLGLVLWLFWVGPIIFK